MTEQTEQPQRIRWRVQDHYSGHPTEEIIVLTNSEALDIYIARHHIDTSKFHFVEAIPLGYECEHKPVE